MGLCGRLTVLFLAGSSPICQGVFPLASVKPEYGCAMESLYQTTPVQCEQVYNMDGLAVYVAPHDLYLLVRSHPYEDWRDSSSQVKLLYRYPHPNAASC